MSIFENWDSEDFVDAAIKGCAIGGLALGTIALFRDNAQNKRIDALDDRTTDLEDRVDHIENSAGGFTSKESRDRILKLLES